MRDLIRFKSKVVLEEYNLSNYAVDIHSIDDNVIETDIAQGLVFESKRSGIIHNFTMDVDPGFKHTEKFRGGIQWYLMESKDLISSFDFRLKNENGDLVSLNGQSMIFRSSIRKSYFFVQ